MKKFKIVALMGKAGSGKDTLLQYLLQDNDGFNEIISCTTRPPRQGERAGFAYKFLTNEEFAAKVLSGEMIEAAAFRDWFYGTTYDSLDENKVNIGVFNPDGIETLSLNKYVDLQVFYVTCSDRIRIIRQLNREDNPDIDEIFRRYKADEEDFMDYDLALRESWFETSVKFIPVKNEEWSDLGLCERTILDNLV